MTIIILMCINWQYTYYISSEKILKTLNYDMVNCMHGELSSG